MLYDEGYYESNFNFEGQNALEELYLSSIMEDEYEVQDDDKQHLKYYIGVCFEDNDGSLLLGMSISIPTLFNYDFTHIARFIDYDDTPNIIHIMQLHISEDLVYNVVLKTFWLKIVQRTWKRIFNQRKTVIQIRKSIYSQQYFSLNGRYPMQAVYLPQYYGCIKKNICQ